jgi:hypothetical protein
LEEEMQWSRSNVKRGDVAVVTAQASSYSTTAGRVVSEETRLYIVTSVSRDGRVKAVRALDSETVQPVERLFGRPVVKTFPAEDVDMAAFVAEAMTHKWPGHEDSSLLMPYADITDVHALVKRHVNALVAA